MPSIKFRQSMINEPINILILEDNEDDVELIRLELDKADFKYSLNHVEGESSLKKFLESEEPPDIVLSDYNIPGYDIHQAKEQLYASDVDVPFVLITGALGDERAVELIVNGICNDYLLKSNLTRLNSSIQRELENYGYQKELNRSREELKKLSLVASQTHNGVIIADKNRRIEWVNKAYTEITEYTLEESIGKKPGDLLQGSLTNQDTIKYMSEMLGKEESFSTEILNYTKEGNTYWIKLDITPVHDEHGELTNFIAIQEDVTERKEAEAKLFESYKQLQRSQEIGQIGSWTYNVLKDESKWSEQMYVLYDIDPDLGPPSASDVLKRTVHHKRLEAEEVVEQAIKFGKPYDITVPLEADQPKYLRVIGIPSFDKDGNVTHLEGTVQDVTDIKLAEQYLSEAKQQIEDIANNMDGVLIQYVLKPDHSDKLQYISQGSEKIFGVTQEAALKDNDIIWKGVHPEDVEDYRNAIKISATELSPINFKWRHFLPDGRLRYLQARGTPTVEEDKSISWNSVIFDITDQILTERKEQELQNLLQTTISEMHVYDAKSYKIMYCNKVTEVNTQYSRKELLEIKPTDLKTKFTHLEFKKMLAEVDKKGKLIFETTQTRKDGSEYDVLVHIKKGIYDNNDVYVANVKDISDKVEAEKSYRETYQTLRSLIEASPIGIYLVDTEGVVIDFWNKAAEKIFGYRRNEAIGHLIPSIDNHDSDELNKLLAQVKGGKALSGKRLKRKKKNGEEITVELHSTPVIGQTGTNQILVLVKDVTELVDHEEALKISLQEKDILVQEVHHRVKNNLAIITGFLEIQLSTLDEGRRERLPLERAMNRIYSIAEVHKLLYEGSNLLNINLVKYMNNLIGNVTHSMNLEESIDVDLQVENIQMNVNELTPLGMLMSELLTNSFKYAFNPGEKGSIAIKISKNDATYHVLYRDNGSGIEEDLLEDSISSGLNIVKILLDQLESTYTLENRDGFYLSFKFNERHKGAHANVSV